MRNTLSNVLIFTVGAAIGSAVTYYFVKTRYENEIASLVDDFSNHKYTGPQDSDEAEATEQNDIPKELPPVNGIKEAYNDVVTKLGYRNYSDIEPTKNENDDVSTDISEDENGPRVITPEEFGANDYKIVELSYWADGVLTDTKNKRIQDVNGLIGNTLRDFGKYEPDALHVRDDERKIDFEILRDLKRYSDFFEDDSPHNAEEE